MKDKLKYGIIVLLIAAIFDIINVIVLKMILF